MRLYRTTFKLGSASASPWQADMLFGHLCWSLVRREGEDFLTDLFLAEYRSGSPPVLLSDGFPSGYLPRPFAAAQFTDGHGQSKKDRVLAYRERKDRIKAGWLTLHEFNCACRGEVVMPTTQPDPSARVVSKNQIDRLTNTAGSAAGKLYDFTEYLLPSVDVYWRISDGYASLVQEFLDDLARTGYGKRKSVGYGQIEPCQLEPFGGFDEVPAANGFVSLCNFVPASSDPIDGCWATTVKYGKLGEERATRGQPFKRPLIQLAAGSSFHATQPREWYGRLVPDMAANPDTTEGSSPFDPAVVQYGFAFAIPVKMPFVP